ncbi:hypothetical protein ACFOMD_13100 [Sphingoaurantiacus capsulatus]|uniref:Uncharacterized protein n=1 Tax=Sphingoaurantiacus capsulatus TaxID=1771310 RepID=A0ABV7XBI0_9SPHN
MRLPPPEIGRVVHYGFVWAGAGRAAPPDAAKSRPCLIVDVEEIVERDAGSRPVKRVTYLPISHTPPRKGEETIDVPVRVAQHLGLTREKSYIYTSYAVEDDWPFDLEARPGSTECDYGLVPPRLFEAVAENFAAYLKRHPQTTHKRSG